MTPDSSPADAAQSPQQSHKKQSNRSSWITGAILILLIIATAFFVDVNEMVRIMLHSNVWLILAGVTFLLGGIFLIDVRWWYLLGRKPSFKRTAHAANVSFIVPILTPAPNYIVRVVTTGVATEATLPQATTSMIVERMIAQIMRITTIVLAISLGVQSTMSPASMLRSIGVSFAVLAGYLLAIRFSTSVTTTLDNGLAHIPRLSAAWRTKIIGSVQEGLSIDVGMVELLIALGVTLIMWSLFFLFHFMVILAMPLNLDAHANITIALGALALTPPSAPAMLGIYQLSQVGPNLILRLGSLEELLPYSLMLYFIQAIVWMGLTVWGLREMDMGFIDLFRIRQMTPEEADAEEKESAQVA